MMLLLLLLQGNPSNNEGACNSCSFLFQWFSLLFIGFPCSLLGSSKVFHWLSYDKSANGVAIVAAVVAVVISSKGEGY